MKHRITIEQESATRWIARFPFSYETKDLVKNAGFRYDPARKLWWTHSREIVALLDPVKARTAALKTQAAIKTSQAVDADISIPVPDGLAYLPYQRAGIAYALSRESTLIADEMGLGKAQPLDAKLLTPTGWKTIGEAYVGMPIIGRDGDTYQVTGVFPQGNKAAYRVRMSDRSSTTCCLDHLWSVADANKRTATLTLRDMMERGFQYNHNPGHNKWQIPTMACASMGILLATTSRPESNWVPLR